MKLMYAVRTASLVSKISKMLVHISKHETYVYRSDNQPRFKSLHMHVNISQNEISLTEETMHATKFS